MISRLLFILTEDNAFLRPAPSYARSRLRLIPDPSFALPAGVNCKPAPNLGLRAEYHHLDGTPIASRLENPGRPATTYERYWSMLPFMVAWRF